MNNIKSTVNKLVKKYLTSDPYELASSLNITIVVGKMPSSIRGFYSRILDMDFIYLNCELDDTDKKIVCAHELGHAILHPCANSLFLSQNTFIVPSKLELQADIFAANLLISDDTLQQYKSNTITVSELSAELNLPTSLLQLKIK